MRSLSRLQLYQEMLEENQYDERLLTLLNVNISVIRDIEPLFLTDDLVTQEIRKDEPDIIELLKQNISGEHRYTSNDANVDKLYHKIERIVQDHENVKDNRSNKNNKNLFNKVLNELGSFNTNRITNDMISGDLVTNNRMIQVFLSHAYDDRLYTYSLFKYFYQQGIYLYVDWMHRKKAKNGCLLKKELKAALDNSSQLLFLRTANSELDIQGKHMLRSWCSWELGNFYRKDKREKYVLNLYSVDEYKNSNLQLHGLKLYTGMSGGLLSGIEITP